MFKRRRPYNDLSTGLRDVQLWNTTPSVSRIDSISDVCTLCVDSGSRLFAVGTSHGEIRIYDDQFKETILATPKSTSVRLLQFARPKDLFKLLCIDSENVFYVWNLDSYGTPPIQTSHPMDGPVYRISTSQSHSHALLATQSGDIVAYNLAKLRLSPYKIPYSLGTQDNSPCAPAIDVVILPHKLNHVLVAYECGIILYDLVSQKVLRTYLLTENKPPPLTILALHPLGQHLAVGYEDGTIRIWDLQSSESAAVWVGSASRKFSVDQPTVSIPREPIFKLEWTLIEEQNNASRSWLTILGGLRIPMPGGNAGSSRNGVTVLRFDTRSFRRGDSTVEISPALFWYPTPFPAQDFTIVSVKHKPLSASVQRPGRLIVFSGDGDQNASIDAFEFPPSNLSSVPVEDNKAVELDFSAELEESEERSRALVAMLHDLKTEFSEEDIEEEGSDSEPGRAPLPFPLLIGMASVLAADMISVNEAGYSRLTRWSGEGTSKDNRYRVLITRHADMSVRFHDVSAFVDGGVDLSLYPCPLAHLTFHVLDVPEIALRPRRADIHIEAVRTSSALECAVLLSTGEVVVFGLGTWSRTQDVLDEEIVDLKDAKDDSDEIFFPRFMLRALNGGTVAVSLSDIGFLAVAYKHGLLIVVDMRGPTVILRDTQDTPSKHGGANVATSLSWSISGLGEDTTHAPRLLVLRHDGTLTTYTLTHGGAWNIDKARTTREAHHSLNAPLLSLVLDAQTGMESYANSANLARVMDMETMTVAKPLKREPGHPHCYWVAANRREIKVTLNVTGEKVAKVNFSAQEALDHVGLVSSYGSSVLITLIRGQGVAYSLPALEAVYTFKLPTATQPLSSFHCTLTGDILQTYQLLGIGPTLCFVSLLRHPGTSASRNVNFRIHKYVNPPETPNAHDQEADSQTWGSSVIGWASWIKTLAEEAVVSGDEIDHMLEGPEIPQVPQVPPSSATPSSSSPSSREKQSTSGVAPMINWGHGVYQQLAAAAAERGERLGQLEDHFQSLEAGSKDMVAQAKKLAERQTAKRWFQ